MRSTSDVLESLSFSDSIIFTHWPLAVGNSIGFGLLYSLLIVKNYNLIVYITD